ncbi:hypothetical protein B9Z55_025034 [Caenorhabditis nigoni]|uniref:Uncharacterized protein n=1 Tax=Caenorhabditis nigoni TaxID=1611254 RepID=A0A2G5SWK4_9PELO|nr:hypothetical protein B9Z55_025034 [Caenorhabditis nigoni]
MNPNPTSLSIQEIVEKFRTNAFQTDELKDFKIEDENFSNEIFNQFLFEWNYEHHGKVFPSIVEELSQRLNVTKVVTDHIDLIPCVCEVIRSFQLKELSIGSHNSLEMFRTEDDDLYRFVKDTVDIVACLKQLIDEKNGNFLKSLRIVGNHKKETFPDGWINQIHKLCPSIEELHLPMCFFSQHDFDFLCENFCTLRCLKINGSEYPSLRGIGQLKNLEVLHAGNAVVESKTDVSELFELQKLKDLDISGHRLSQKVKWLLETRGNFPLKVLNCAYNDVSLIDVYDLCERFPSLETICLIGTSLQMDQDISAPRRNIELLTVRSLRSAFRSMKYFLSRDPHSLGPFEYFRNDIYTNPSYSRIFNHIRSEFEKLKYAKTMEKTDLRGFLKILMSEMSRKKPADWIVAPLLALTKSLTEFVKFFLNLKLINVSLSSRFFWKCVDDTRFVPAILHVLDRTPLKIETIAAESFAIHNGLKILYDYCNFFPESRFTDDIVERTSRVFCQCEKGGKDRIYTTCLDILQKSMCKLPLNLALNLNEEQEVQSQCMKLMGIFDRDVAERFCWIIVELMKINENQEAGPIDLQRRFMNEFCRMMRLGVQKGKNDITLRVRNFTELQFLLVMNVKAMDIFFRKTEEACIHVMHLINYGSTFSKRYGISLLVELYHQIERRDNDLRCHIEPQLLAISETEAFEIDCENNPLARLEYIVDIGTREQSEWASWVIENMKKGLNPDAVFDFRPRGKLQR